MVCAGGAGYDADAYRALREFDALTDDQLLEALPERLAQLRAYACECKIAAKVDLTLAGLDRQQRPAALPASAPP